MAGLVQNLLATVCTTFGIGPKGARATLDASALTADRTFSLPNKNGTVAMMSDIAGGEPDVDGGSFTDTYTSMTGAVDGGAGFA